MIRLFKILSVVPLVLMQALGWLLGWLVFLTSASYRRRLLENARCAGLGWRQWARAVGHGGCLLAELPRLWLGRSVPVRWYGVDAMEHALAQGRGVILLTPHLGGFEMVWRSYAERFGQAGHPLTLLFRPARKLWLRPVVGSARARPGLLAAPTTLAGVKQLVKALRAGHAVMLLPDQVPAQGLGVWANFFGRSAYTPTLAARLAHQSGASLVLGWGVRRSWGRGFDIHYEALHTALPDDAAQAAQCINTALESVIARCPQQYLWSYARYKPPRRETP